MPGPFEDVPLVQEPIVPDVGPAKKKPKKRDVPWWLIALVLIAAATAD